MTERSPMRTVPVTSSGGRAATDPEGRTRSRSRQAQGSDPNANRSRLASGGLRNTRRDRDASHGVTRTRSGTSALALAERDRALEEALHPRPAELRPLLGQGPGPVPQ